MYDRPVSFQIQSVSLTGLSGGVVQVLNQDRTGSVSRQDGYITGQDSKCNRQAVESTIEWFSGGQSHSPDADFWRVGEISNMSNILPILCDKLEKYKQPLPTL